MTIYDLLKNSSPSMARHFKESEENTKKNAEDITKLETRVSTLETGGSSTIYEPFITTITGQDGFELKHKQINNVTHDAYYMYKHIIPSSDGSFIYAPLFSPHCSEYLLVDGTKVYIAVPIMDEDGIYISPDKLGIAIKRQYDIVGNLSDIDILVTKKLYDSLSNGSTTIYKLYL